MTAVGNNDPPIDSFHEEEAISEGYKTSAIYGYYHPALWDHDKSAENV